MSKRMSFILLLIVLVFCSGGVAEAGSKMKLKSIERVSAKSIRVYFKPVKKAKTYKVEYYWEKGEGKKKISKAYYKLVDKKKVKKNKKGSYITVPARATTQYCSISYRTSNKKGSKWKSWSGYKVTVCKHKYKFLEKVEKYDDEEGIVWQYDKYKCERCGYVLYDGAIALREE